MCLNISLLETLPPASLHLISSWKPASLKLIFWKEGWPFLPGVMGDSCLCLCLPPEHGSLSHCPAPRPSLILLPAPVRNSQPMYAWVPELSDSPRAWLWPAGSPDPGCCCHLSWWAQGHTATLHVSSRLGLCWKSRTKPHFRLWFFRHF